MLPLLRDLLNSDGQAWSPFMRGLILYRIRIIMGDVHKHNPTSIVYTMGYMPIYRLILRH